MRRVVVTGLGLVTPLGADVETAWKNIIAAKSGAGTITRFDATDFQSNYACEVKPAGHEYGFDPSLRVDHKVQRQVDPFIVYGIDAAGQAIEDAGLTDMDEATRFRAGCSIGSGIGGLPGIESESLVLAEKGPKRVSPHFVHGRLINLISGQVSIKYGLMGPNHAVVTACSTGAHSIGDAARMIAMDDADIMLAGGAESTICPIGIAGFGQARALSTGFRDAPWRASRPWDQDRDGFVMGEGAAALVLESYESAKARGATILGFMLGAGDRGDGFHRTRSSPDGKPILFAMKDAIADAGLTPDDIDYVNAHGTSTPENDKMESFGCMAVMGERMKEVPISSNKSMIGHTLTAAGAVEAVTSMMTLAHQRIPPTINYRTPDPAIPLDVVPNEARDAKVRYVLSNSFGFGGQNTCLVMGLEPAA